MNENTAGLEGAALRDFFAAHTHVSWADAVQIAKAAGVREPDVDDIVVVRARIRMAEAQAMMQLREEMDEG